MPRFPGYGDSEVYVILDRDAKTSRIEQETNRLRNMDKNHAVDCECFLRKLL